MRKLPEIQGAHPAEPCQGLIKDMPALVIIDIAGFGHQVVMMADIRCHRAMHPAFHTFPNNSEPFPPGPGAG